ncbi:MAG TPA: NAD(P)H-dependent glycerol-3-phosphate dehydrogenase [Microthrixaceae bacterium]|jgi:glycerol-3-phosphate dehydrogenase (NAD(P)+)|nr:NAD(P)H-dependent glycerol-3-phosphate dehydrogenase [Microthrixaceae bacterium]
MRITVGIIGGGSWGTTVGHLAAHNVSTVLWARHAETAEEINSHHRNSRYLDGFDLHPALRATADLGEAVRQADVLVMGVPSQSFRSTLEEVSDHLRAWVPIVSLAKGLEQGTRLRMSEVAHQVVPGHPVAVLTGPNLAKEILAGDAAASVLATHDPVVAARLQEVFSTNLFRVYTNPDVVGCEVAGALKNVIAIASGMADGLGAGDNTRAAVITRGLAELSRLGVAMGGNELTFAGLAGMGDLLATCISPQSRNRHVGEQLGRGRSIDEVVAEMNMVAEGVKTAPVVLDIGAEFGIDVPISSQVYAVCHQGRPAAEAYEGLLRKGSGVEHPNLDF